MNKSYNTIDEYIADFPPAIQVKLQQLREIIASTAPEAGEVISYGMPAFRYKKVLVYFAAHKQHIGLYPTPSAIEAFRNRLAGYQFSKGAIQIPLDESIPDALIEEIVRFRLAEVKSSVRKD